jgi:glycosyltransferase involved in cell wall biosynthesis
MPNRGLTVVVPVLDEADGIAAHLRRLQGLRARGVEIVVADGGSTDRTVDRVGNLADRVVVA